MAVFFGCLLLLSSAFASVERRNTVCYNPFGCFSSDGLLKAPQSPDIIDTYFRLYVRGHSSHINEIGGKAGRVMSDFNSCSILYGIHQIPGIRLFQSRYTIYIINRKNFIVWSHGFRGLDNERPHKVWLIFALATKHYFAPKCTTSKEKHSCCIMQLRRWTKTFYINPLNRILQEQVGSEKWRLLPTMSAQPKKPRSSSTVL